LGKIYGINVVILGKRMDTWELGEYIDTALETTGNTKLDNIVSNNYSQWGESCGANGNIDALNTSNIGIVTRGYHILNNSF
jgi:hypothetical protein